MKKFKRCDHRECNDGYVYFKELHGGLSFNAVRPCPKCRGEMLVSDDRVEVLDG